MTLIDQTKEADNGTITAEAAQAVLTEQRQKRVEACRDEIQAILEKHKCVLAPMPYIVASGEHMGRVLARLEIVASD